MWNSGASPPALAHRNWRPPVPLLPVCPQLVGQRLQALASDQLALIDQLAVRHRCRLGEAQAIFAEGAVVGDKLGGQFAAFFGAAFDHGRPYGREISTHAAACDRLVSTLAPTASRVASHPQYCRGERATHVHGRTAHVASIACGALRPGESRRWPAPRLWPAKSRAAPASYRFARPPGASIHR